MGEERELGLDPETSRMIVAKNGRFGPYVTEILPEDSPKSAKPRTGIAVLVDEPRLRSASTRRCELMSLPRVVGKDGDGVEITAQNGRYGPYLKKGTDSRSLESEDQIFAITLPEAEAIYAQPKQRGRAAAKPPLKELGADPASGRPMIIKDGRFGAYVTDGEVNATLRRGDDVETITAERAAELLAEKRAKGPAPKKRPAKRTPKRLRRRQLLRNRPRNGCGEEDSQPRPADSERRMSPAVVAITIDTRWQGSTRALRSDRGVKKKRRKAKSAQDRRGSLVAARPAEHLPMARARIRPASGCYDMPYSAPAPRMINPDLGLHNLVARAGHNAAYEIDVTLLDAPDHRLIRSGVLLAHRVLDGRGEWYHHRARLAAAAAEGPDRADGPRRSARGAGGPDPAVASPGHAGPGRGAELRSPRVRAARRSTGTTMALLRDDKVTVRRGGLTTARYREVMITPIGPGLTDEQVSWLDRALLQAGATHVPRFPRLVTRLGAPATGPTDLPVPGPFDAAAPSRRFVSQLVARRLRQIVEADLAIRGGDLGAVDRLADQARRLRLELKGLSVGARPGVGRGSLRRARLDQPGAATRPIRTVMIG